MIGAITPQIKEMRERLARSRQFLREQTPLQPQVALLLDSPFGAIVDKLQKAISFNYSQVPYLPCRPDHWDGTLTIGKLGPRAIAVLRGPLPLYEGFRQQDAVLPIRLLQALTVPMAVMVGTAAALRRDWEVGGLLLVTDHVNLTGRNPLIGANDPDVGPRIVRMEPPGRQFALIAEHQAQAQGITCHRGTYAVWQGPAGPTRAEVEMLRLVQADALGLSFLPEAIGCVHGGIFALELLLLTHHILADAPYPAPAEVAAAVQRHAPGVESLIEALVTEIAV